MSHPLAESEQEPWDRRITGRTGRRKGQKCRADEAGGDPAGHRARPGLLGADAWPEFRPPRRPGPRNTRDVVTTTTRRTRRAISPVSRPTERGEVIGRACNAASGVDENSRRGGRGEERVRRAGTARQIAQPHSNSPASRDGERREKARMTRGFRPRARTIRVSSQTRCRREPGDEGKDRAAEGDRRGPRRWPERHR